MIDFRKYFHSDHQIFLENINYELQKPNPGSVQMNCKDTIIARIIGPFGIKVTFNRAVSFEPEGPFYLSVSFSVIMRFREDTKDEIDWKSVDIASEFREGGGVILHNLASRASLLISEITSASGGAPIITPSSSAHKK